MGLGAANGHEYGIHATTSSSVSDRHCPGSSAAVCWMTDVHPIKSVVIISHVLCVICHLSVILTIMSSIFYVRYR